MHSLFAAILSLCLLLVASGGHAQTDPKKLKDQLTGDAKGAAAANPQCRLFTLAEIGGIVGVAVGPGENAGGGTGCSWSDKDYEAGAMVTVVPPNYFPQPRLVPGFKRLPDVGKNGWVAPDSGWSAGAIVGEAAIVVNVHGKKAAEATAVSMLKEVIKRRAR